MSQSRQFATERLVEFCDTDTAGIAHFSAFVCYMEQAEHAFWRHLGTSVVRKLSEGGHLSWPRVRVECDFRGTAKFEDVLQISVSLLKLGSKSVTFGFTFSRDGECIAEGKLVTVCCRVEQGKKLESMQIPQELRGKLTPYLA